MTNSSSAQWQTGVCVCACWTMEAKVKGKGRKNREQQSEKMSGMCCREVRWMKSENAAGPKCAHTSRGRRVRWSDAVREWWCCCLHWWLYVIIWGSGSHYRCLLWPWCAWCREDKLRHAAAVMTHSHLSWLNDNSPFFTVSIVWLQPLHWFQRSYDPMNSATKTTWGERGHGQSCWCESVSCWQAFTWPAVDLNRTVASPPAGLVFRTPFNNFCPELPLWL